MAYSVLPSSDAKAFLRELNGLSREARLKLVAGLFEPLREDGDCFRRHGERLDPDHFWYSLILHTDPPRAFRFLVRDVSAVYGVLEVVYAEELTG